MFAQFFLVLLVSSNFISFLQAEDFSCPVNHITKDNGVSGIIPAGATSKVKIPAGTDCTYVFDIPKGFALKMETSAVYDVSPGDSIMFDYFYISSPAEKEVDYAINKTLPYRVISVTGNLTFIATYTYLDLSNYQQVIKPTGTYFNASLEPNKYFTINASSVNDQVNLKYGTRPSAFFDWSVFKVFVFDGSDIFNSEYAGRITQVFGKQNEYYSSSNTLTLVDLYGNPSDSLFLGNDASTVENMDQYGIFVIDSDKELHGWMDCIGNQPDAWYTVICDDCPSFSIESILFDSKETNPRGYVEVQGMSPTQRLPAILKYPFSSNTNNSLPQFIPSSMATFHIHDAYIAFLMQPGIQKQDFSVAPGNSRSVYSPQLWNPNAQPKFDYTFSDPLDVFINYNFSISLENIGLENDGDELDVQVRLVNGLTTLDKKYTKTKMANQVISGIGKYLNLKYTGTKSSEVILSFNMIDPSNPDGTTQSPGTTGSTNASPKTSISTVSSPPVTSVSTRATRIGSTSSNSHVETTTSSATSLLPTGLLIIIIAVLTF